jgi:peptidoglycan-N-acetylglucosamine deacetylase
VVLTFDDGPHPEGTRAVLAGLAEFGLRATFFVVGEQAVCHPSVICEVAAAGHEVALHGYRHVRHAFMRRSAVLRDLDRGQGEIESILGQPIRAVRAPYGAASLATVEFAERRGLVLAGWSRWGWDWSHWATTTSIARSLTRDVGPGDILLLHDSDAYAATGSWRRTAEALLLIARALEARGLATQTLSDGRQR